MPETRQRILPGLAQPLPEGFVYASAVVSVDQEAELLQHFRQLAFREFEFHGYQGRRRVVYFGYRYDFNESTLAPAEPIPPFLLPLRGIAASFASIDADELQHALVTEYAAGAGIGWHKDRPNFNDVIGVSFASPCRFRLRRRNGDAWQRASILLEPRSAYLLRGPVRTDWEHSIPPGESLRYSVTFRSMNAVPPR